MRFRFLVALSSSHTCFLSFPQLKFSQFHVKCSSLRGRNHRRGIDKVLKQKNLRNEVESWKIRSKVLHEKRRKRRVALIDTELPLTHCARSQSVTDRSAPNNNVSFFYLSLTLLFSSLTFITYLRMQ